MQSTSGFIRAAVASLVLAGGVASAQTYPVRPVTAVPAFPPGAPNDVIMRMVGEQFGSRLKQTLVVDNRPGAGGNIAAEFVARSLPDGYTLLATIDTVITANPALYKSGTFRADADLIPVMYLANTAQTLVCHPSVPVRTVSDFVAHAKQQSLSYASGGYGVPGHLAAELFMAASGVKMNHVAYRGPGPATQDVLAGVVPCGFLATPVVMPHVKSGKLSALAVTSPKRSPIAPDVPTMSEAGIPAGEAAFGEVLMVAKDTPAVIVSTLNREMAKMLEHPDVRAKMLAMDLEFVPNTPEEAGTRLQREGAHWRQVIDRLGLKIQ
jgi:tripartite-type tricarboxylate transporter receptor subunit TctC